MTLIELIGLTLEKEKIEIRYPENTEHGVMVRNKIGFLNDEFNNYELEKLIEKVNAPIECIYVSPFNNCLVIELEGYNEALEEVVDEALKSIDEVMK